MKLEAFLISMPGALSFDIMAFAYEVKKICVLVVINKNIDMGTLLSDKKKMKRLYYNDIWRDKT